MQRWEDLLFRCWLLKQRGIDVSHIEPTVRLWLNYNREKEAKN